MNTAQQIVNDLANTAGDRAIQALRDVIALCDTPEQAGGVACGTLGIFAIAVCGHMAATIGRPLDQMDAADMLEAMAAQLRNAKREG